jgi:hypothetical protein
VITTRMVRDQNINKTNPTIDDVRQVMDLMPNDDEEQCLELSFEKSVAGQVFLSSRLLIIRVNNCDTGSQIGWLVEHSAPKGKGCKLLATHNRPDHSRQTVEFFGALESVRDDCILNEVPVLEAVSWFLETGEAQSTRYWIDYFDAVVSL